MVVGKKKAYLCRRVRFFLFKKTHYMKYTLALLVLLFTISSAYVMGCRQYPATPDGTFTVLVEDERYVTKDIDLPSEDERGVVDVSVASDWLVSVAEASASLTQTAEMISQEKSLFKAVTKAIPLLLTDIPVWVKGWKSLKKFKSFYVAAGGLTPEERAVVTQKFSQAFSIPFQDAEKVAEAAIEASLGVINLTNVIITVVKK